MPIPQLRDNPNYYSQKKDLLNTFDKFLEYKLIHSQVLQDCIKRVKPAFEMEVPESSPYSNTA